MKKLNAPILLALDSFKNSFHSIEINEILASYLKEINNDLQIIALPLADGGEGSLEVLNFYKELERVQIKAFDPIHRSIESWYLCDPKEEIAYIELANICGLELVSPFERNILHSSSYGLGQVIKDALLKQPKQINVFIGGSATNDLGIGMLDALGVEFYVGQQRIAKPVANDLSKIDSFKVSDAFSHQMEATKIVFLRDVKNPLLGNQGAANTYAKQKGANPSEIAYLEEGAMRFSKLCTKHIKQNYTNIEGAGAAGGIAFGAINFLGAKLSPGIDFLLNVSNFNKVVQSARLVITGEGKFDQQTLHGKLISGILDLCKIHDKPVAILCAISEWKAEQLLDLGISKQYVMYPSPPKRIDKSDSLRKLRRLCKQIMKDMEQLSC